MTKRYTWEVRETKLGELQVVVDNTKEDCWYGDAMSICEILNCKEERIKELERKIDRQESVINIILNNLPIHQAADIQKFVVESLKEWDVKKTMREDNQENEVKECQFCGEFRTEYHEYEDYSWSAEDYCNAGHDLEDTDPNTCKDYWDK